MHVITTFIHTIAAVPAWITAYPETVAALAVVVAAGVASAVIHVRSWRKEA